MSGGRKGKGQGEILNRQITSIAKEEKQRPFNNTTRIKKKKKKKKKRKKLNLGLPFRP